MVSPRLWTWATVRPYNHFVMFSHRRAVKLFSTGLMSGALFLAWVSHVQDNETHISRVESSIQYRENYAMSHDDDVHRLPASEHAAHAEDRH
ncbi:hypothetical protein FNF27_02218 [Cafeteria roenbergensis]|uniref:Transmembrane protein n=1 Tax=Cafeteria roenbergensis TaxID=33653 RepID=A0A5A8DRH5_CAFRO|nr:hypothetical protein FNF29_02367 [Cafeteria roenbergensis]KAA0159900.1 hypothetical protein FNF28_05628 [Cafeteria roenbergensis]KAA0168003.1 hypothetical protein FNF31_00502 [Cafeteria roenbergensis]KAA0176161.1 hypothetical protein FNF27_02218 [Cafeteria roenbergensis]|eukprot:KAA0154490.1 hypothetical protein FNF29_02367 [Cafeteria roenbergensis]